MFSGKLSSGVGERDHTGISNSCPEPRARTRTDQITRADQILDTETALELFHNCEHLQGETSTMSSGSGSGSGSDESEYEASPTPTNIGVFAYGDSVYLRMVQDSFAPVPVPPLIRSQSCSAVCSVTSSTGRVSPPSLAFSPYI